MQHDVGQPSQANQAFAVVQIAGNRDDTSGA
jgi:hypothetical protein